MKRNKKRRTILFDATRPLLAYVERATIKDDTEEPLFRPMTPAAGASSDGTWTARPPGVWSKKIAGPPAPTSIGWAAGVSASTRCARPPSTTPSATGRPCTRCAEFAGRSDIRTTELYFVRKEEDAEVAAPRILIRRTGLQVPRHR